MAHETKSVIVTVGDDALADIHDVATRLERYGLNVTRVLPGTGVIAGSVAASAITKLRGVQGVTSVEEELSALPAKE